MAVGLGSVCSRLSRELMDVSYSSTVSEFWARSIDAVECNPAAVELQPSFFSSRRRHTMYWRDWSSDVCSSDLNDIILLFLGIELASIPTYIMVSISRPLPVAQEAGVKYFFLGAMSAAVMLFGFSYLYGTTGLTSLSDITAHFGRGGVQGRPALSSWQQLAVTMLVAGFAFKAAAVPLHFYAGDVYQGAATPITAFLSFVPKAGGFVALIKLVFLASGGAWEAPAFLQKLLWVMAVLTMTAGNVLGLLQFNVKRVLAYSSIAHTGYMLVGLTA